ncbi:ATP-binding and permease protein, ABC-type transporter [Aurantimonas manganoxydans SI85-9A1]|uniref:ATP-binding and permease protein, ABC-type transporter n=1 Tax=Aurantimonas manganoxydans (strain ATCC BAA-1229 / DSM 21871 / SI85-9A1) TaxID=287752 RepID=Q1YKT6_AURMS|nr:ABC transporter ATP-binding protein [Aurantimonas manganoxydans]EAS50437.1 ATP-binding and permease protein, ABC-type transporter [Aurantimonas manganoxydans SI85-9A1]
MLARFFSYYAPWRGLFVLDFGCAVLAGLLELAFPIAVKVFIDTLLPSGEWNLIIAAAVGLLAIYLLNTGLMAVVTYWGHMLGINIETEMRRRAFDHLQKLSFGYFDNQKTGHLVGRLTKDLEEIGEIAHHGPEDLFIAVMTFLGAFVLMLFVHVDLALITAVVVPVGTILTVRYGARMTDTWRAIYSSVGAFNARIEENVGGIRVVQAFANEDHERALFARDNAQYRGRKLDAYRIMSVSQSLNYLSMRLTQVIVMVAGTYYVIEGDLTNGGFVGFLLLVGVFFRPVEKIAAVLESYPKGIAGFRRYCDFLDTEPDIVDRPGARAVDRLAGDICFSNVHFTYSTGHPVLNGIDLSVKAGETIAFVGPSGAGKTTICALVPRFYDLVEGAITIDGIDIRDLQLAALRSHIGVVQQDVFLFGGTIRDNVAYGRLDAGDAQIWEALERAHLADTVKRLPDGLDTIVGERGLKLSGGQKQRLSIARMFLKDPAILILDEATSALDTATERAIQTALAELARGRTTLVVAHRLSTIRHADRIVVVDAGRIVEEGAHDALLQKDGAYRRLVLAQEQDVVRPAILAAE